MPYASGKAHSISVSIAQARHPFMQLQLTQPEVERLLRFNRSSATSLYATTRHFPPSHVIPMFQSLKRDIPLCNVNVPPVGAPVIAFQSLKRDIPLCNSHHGGVMRAL